MVLYIFRLSFVVSFFNSTLNIKPHKAITTHQPKAAYQPNVDVPEMKAKAPNFCENLIYLELEGSSQWPQNVNAIRKLRAAYHIRLGDLLTNKFKIKSAIGDDGMSVLSRVGNFIFKLVTVYKREAQIMKEYICPKTGTISVDRSLILLVHSRYTPNSRQFQIRFCGTRNCY